MLIRLILDPAEKDRSGANQMRQWFSFGQHSRRGNAPSHLDRRATVICNRYEHKPQNGDQLRVQVVAPTQFDARQMLHLQYRDAEILFGPVRTDLTRAV
jgi:hypothetical protein